MTTDQRQTVSVADLARFAIFGDLERDDIVEFLRTAKVRSYSPMRPSIFQQGDPGDGMYIVLSGEVDIYSLDTAKRKHLIGTLGEGEFFGEMSLIEEKGRAASAEAKGEARLIFLGRDAFTQMQKTQPAVLNRILLRMMREMSHRLRLLDQRYVTSKAALGVMQGF